VKTEIEFADMVSTFEISSFGVKIAVVPPVGTA
jgi:hypothetical protein